MILVGPAISADNFRTHISARMLDSVSHHLPQSTFGADGQALVMVHYIATGIGGHYAALRA